MPTLKIINSSYQSNCLDDLLVVEIDDLAASTIGGGASTGAVATAMVFDDSTAWTITSSKSTAEGMEVSIEIGATPSVAGASYRFNVGDKSSEYPLSHFLKQKFDGRQGIYSYHRSLLDYLFTR
jgi:hypothetical protein